MKAKSGSSAIGLVGRDGCRAGVVAVPGRPARAAAAAERSVLPAADRLPVDRAGHDPAFAHGVRCGVRVSATESPGLAAALPDDRHPGQSRGHGDDRARTVERHSLPPAGRCCPTRSPRTRPRRSARFPTSCNRVRTTPTSWPRRRSCSSTRRCRRAGRSACRTTRALPAPIPAASRPVRRCWTGSGRPRTSAPSAWQAPRPRSASGVTRAARWPRVGPRSCNRPMRRT